jgi:low temperature requirement protein LtrA
MVTLFLSSLRFAIGSWIYRALALSTSLILSAAVAKATDFSSSTPEGTQGGVSAVWVFANLSFAGMRAQAKGSTFWKVVSFIFGFPGTLLTLLVVKSGSERAYGIDLPRRQ